MFAAINQFLTALKNLSYAGLFNGSNKYLSLASNAAFQFPSSGSFTIECWVYLNATGAYQYVYSAGTATGTTDLYFGVYNSDQLALVVSSGGGAGSYLAVGSTTLTTGIWYHIAVSRDTSTVKLFLNGVAETMSSVSGTSTVAMPSAVGPAYVGTYFGSSAFFNGYISNFRVVKGTAVYTSNFIVPTPPLAAISGTSLLTLQNATIVDNSTNAFTITNNGAVVMSQQQIQ